ncbi:MAG: septal ring lytic transglycosylase RlpA family lipoprotein [Methylotenera sp.]|nr:MAG: septal ring lytic transglycosylase RlpA family lipoprotein [Methylotenera sp.]
MKKRIVVLLLCTFFLTACGSPKVVKPLPSSTQSSNQTSKVPPVTTSKSGGYYLDDGPGDNPPKDIDSIPNAIPKNEPYLARTTKPYKALGATYTPMTSWQPYKERGVASWYGKRYHGRRTASGEVYDMYSMSAAHTTLPLPSYVKVTNPANGRFVIVRVNDRGPFKSNRIIDLSYAAAYQLRFASIGSTLVEVEAIDPNNTASYAQAAPAKVADLPRTQATPTTPANNNFTIAPQYFVQVGAFKNEVNAQALAKRVQSLDIAQNAGINTVYNDYLHRLKLGPYENKSEAEKIVYELRKLLNLRAIITNQ